MSVLISCTKLKKSFASRPLFDGISFAVESGERIGLIGPNGAGKSTLLKIIADTESPDDGIVSRQRGLKIGLVEQVPHFTPDVTVEDTIMEGVNGSHDARCLAIVREYMSRLSLDSKNNVGGDTPISTLSGGWKKRAALARELVKEPDLLLLDEPTNHLDVESILWLEDFLSNAPFAAITVTHDRLFLQRISNRILELDRRNPGGLFSVNGSYADYLESKEMMISAQERREDALKNTLRRETEWLRRGVMARGTKQQARIKQAAALKDEVEELEYRNAVRTAKLDFVANERNPKKLIRAKGISKSYGDNLLFKDVNLLITPGIKLGLLGANGCGKSTLIRVLLGEETPDSGSIERYDRLEIAYFEQNRETLDPAATVANTLCPQGDHVKYRGEHVHVRSYLDRFIFNQSQMDMEVGRLSGGEQSRLLIARLMLREANILVLDEPTNDLDMATLKVLEECLLEFPGAVILVTHDRYFLDQVANHLVAFGELNTPDTGKVTSFASLEQWERLYNEMRAARISKEALVPTKTDKATKPKVRRTLSFKDQYELDHMEETIHKAEADLKRLTEESLLPEVASDPKRLMELMPKIAELQIEIDRLYSRWAELANLSQKLLKMM